MGRVIVLFLFFYERAEREGGGGRGRCQTFSFLFFPCSADHERDWPPCKVVFFGLATNALNVRNNNNNNRVVYIISKPRQGAHQLLITRASNQAVPVTSEPT